MLLLLLLKHKSLFLLPFFGLQYIHSFFFPCFSFSIFFWSFGYTCSTFIPLSAWSLGLFFDSCHIFFIFLFLNPCLCPSSMVDLILHSAYLPCLFFFVHERQLLVYTSLRFLSLSVLPFCINISTLFDIISFLFFFLVFFWLNFICV